MIALSVKETWHCIPTEMVAHSSKKCEILNAMVEIKDDMLWQDGEVEHANDNHDETEDDDDEQDIDDDQDVPEQFQQLFGNNDDEQDQEFLGFSV